MDKEEFLKQVNQSNLSDQDKKIWQEAAEFLSLEAIRALGEEIVGQSGRLAEMTADLQRQKETIKSLP